MNTLSKNGLGCHTSIGYPGGAEPKRNLAVKSTVDLGSVIGASYHLTVAKQRRRPTSVRLLPDRSNSATHCRGDRRYIDENVSQITVT